MMSKKSSHGSDQGAFGAGLSKSNESTGERPQERAPQSEQERAPKPAQESSPWGARKQGSSQGEKPEQGRKRGPRRRRGSDSRDEQQTEAPRAKAPEPVDPVEAYTAKLAEEGPPGLTGFARFNLGKRIERGIDEAGYTSPRPIQEGSIAEILEGRDILGLAQTGTGKTAAFVLPILHRLLTTKSPKKGRPRVLVVSPTRELTNQIHQEFLALGQFTGVTAMTIFGGVSANPQLRALRAKPDVLVACPGRLLDLVGQGAVQLDGIEVLVLDEADHMFDMGFLPDVRRILKALPPRRQNLLYSATMPKEIRHLTKEVLTDPHVVELNHHAPVETIEHSLYPVHPTRKGDLLRTLIDGDGFKTAIVFTRTKFRAKSLARKLDRDGHRAVALQGNMSQPQRDRAMAGFKSGAYDILVATDIAARGIDVAGVSHVINYDVPNTPEAYMHRIGRTGRSEMEGKAFTFVTHEDFPQVKAIEKKLGSEIARVKLKEYAVGSKDGDDLKRGPADRSSANRQSGGGGFRPKAGQSRGAGAGSRPKGAGGRRRGGGGGGGRGR